MAAFRQHLAFSSLLGVAYSGGVVALGHDWSHAAVAGLLCGASGMLPDLDSPSSRPTREIFAFVSALGPLLILNRFAAAGLSSEVGFLVAAGVYFLLRFGLACFFARFTVHRGMLHSIPAAIIVGQLVYLLHDCADPWGNLILAGGGIARLLFALATGRIVQRGCARAQGAVGQIGRQRHQTQLP